MFVRTQAKNEALDLNLFPSLIASFAPMSFGAWLDLLCYVIFHLFSLLRLAGEIKSYIPYLSRPIFFHPSSRIKVDMQSYKSKPTDKREQYDWRTEKNLDVA